MTLADTLHAALGNANVAAFLRVIRAGESSQDDDAYRMRFGGSLIEAPPWIHPQEVVRRSGIDSTACGAYQFLGRTWTECAKALDLADFSPPNQDLAAVFLIQRRKALDDVIAGRLEAAIAKCCREWASLPGSPYGQPVMTLDKARAVYEQHGGEYATEPAPIAPEQPVSDAPADPAPTTPPEPPRRTMPVFLSALLQLIPGLITVFGKGERAQQNAQTFQVVSDAVVKAVPGATDLPSAIGAMVADPALKATVEAKVMEEPSVRALIEVGGGIGGARDADNKATQGERAFWYSPVFWITVALLPLVYGTVYLVLTGDGFSEEIKTVVVTAIVSGVLSSITGYFLGSALGSAQKQATIDNQLRR